MQYDIKSIAKHFHIEGSFRQAEPFGSGHINDTFVIICQRNTNCFRYVLQRINHEVFKNPPTMMENIIRVTEHISKKLQAHDPVLAARQLKVIKTDDNTGCYKDKYGNYWRMYNLIENAFTCDVMENDAQAFEAARMFGWFQKMLIDLPGSQLHETIPDFHNTPKRFKDFQKVLKADLYNRAGGVKAEIDFAFEHAGICDVLLNLVGTGQIPVRITHNDTKINNIMLDKKTGRGVCVIDLDTVMPGLSLYDFGDMVRTATSPSDEDEPDLSKVVMQMPRFEKLVEGFVQETGDFLTDTEKQHIVSGCKVIIFEQFIRFLGDHLAGDKYYKIHRENHNLDRSRTQMKLLQSIIAQEEQMNKVIKDCG
jgi:thiamine kinase-like enzyme